MCILDTYTLDDDVLKPVTDILFASSLSDEAKETIDKQLWYIAMDDIVAMHDLDADIAEKMRGVYLNLEASKNIKSFGDEDCILELPGKRYLVTSGYTKFQNSKIDNLGVRHLFDEIIIDVIDVPAERKGKEQIFQEILEENGWQPKDVLVVGDSPHSELPVATKLGIPTAQTLRPTVQKYPEATYHIESLCELKDIVT